MEKRLLRLAFSSCAALLFSVSAFAQQNVKGALRSLSGTPLIGAAVTVKGTNQTATTDENGRFIINAPAGSTLVVSLSMSFIRGKQQPASGIRAWLLRSSMIPPT